MMKIVIYEDQKSLLNFYQKYTENHKSIHFLTPSPQDADAIRKNIAKKNKVDTISSYLEWALTQKKDLDSEKYLRKSNLLIHLTKYFMLYEGEQEWTHFLAAYEVFSNLRSFTLDNEILNDLLQFYPSEISIPCQLFLKGIQIEEIADEHQKVSDISFWIKKGEIEVSQINVINGFRFLNGHQVDLIKSMSIHSEVIIPIGRSLFDNKKNQDWISWFMDSNTQLETLLPADKKRESIPLIRFNQHQKQSFIQDFINKNQEAQLIHLSREKEEKHLFSFPRGEIFYKQKINPFNELISFYKDKIPKETVKNQFNLHQFIKWCQKEIEHNKGTKDETLRFKILDELIEITQKIIFKEDLSLTPFMLESLFYILELNLPRIYSFPLLDKKSPYKIMYWKEKLEIESESPSLFIADELTTFFTKSDKIYPNGLLERLFAIGPVPRGEWDFLHDVHEFESLLNRFRSILAIPSGIEDHQIEWKRILKKFNWSESKFKPLETVSLPWKYDLEQLPRKIHEKKISASRLQEYLNCPQQYYFKYVESLFPEVSSKEELNYLDLGTLEHLILQKYYLKTQSFSLDDKIHEQLINEELNKFIKNKQLDINFIERKKYQEELKNFTANALTVLNKISQLYPGLQWEFEKKIKINGISGSIDLFGYSAEQKILLDFKRSSSSIPRHSQFNNFDKIQLWFYLSRLNEMEEVLPTDKILMGYIPMASLENIWFSGNLDLIDASFYKYYSDPIFDQLLPLYKNTEEELIGRFQNDSKFNPNPKNAESCSFCPLQAICPAGINEEAE